MERAPDRFSRRSSMVAHGAAVALIRREGEYWTIAHGGQVIRLRHGKGLGYLERLLREPGRAFPVGELAGPPRRPHQPPASPDCARVAVTKAIRGAIRRVGQYDPSLGGLLQRSIRTGASCVYVPVPGSPTCWEA